MPDRREMDRKNPVGDIFRRFKEAKTSQGLTVEARGEEYLHRWLKLEEASSRNPFLRRVVDEIEDRVTLGTLVVQDGVIEAIQAGIAYDRNEMTYDITSVFVFHYQDMPTLESMSSSKDLVQALRNAIGAVNNKTSVAPPSTLKEPLEKALKGHGFSVEEGPRGSLIIENQGDDATERQFILHPINDPRADAYRLTVEGTSRDSLETFTENYRQLAELTQHIGDTIYATKDTQAPEQTFVIAPAKNFEAIIENTEEIIEAQKKMLSATGIMEDEKGIAEEIKSKIVLERRPDVTFDDIGGCEEAKRQLKTVVKALKDPSAYARWGTSAPSGVLLYGEPGTGKTLLAKALAREANAGIYVVGIPDVLHSLFGRTEKYIQAIFNEAKKNAPVIIFMDEIDALAGHRQFSTEVTSRIVSVLLTNLEGLRERDSGIVIVGATNLLGSIDKALLRPGRFDLVVNVPLPEEEQRKQIFEIHMNSGRKKAGRELFDGSIDLLTLASKAHGFSGADIREIVRRVLAEKVEQEDEGHKVGLVTMKGILDVIKLYEKIGKDTREARMGFPIPNNNNRQ